MKKLVLLAALSTLALSTAAVAGTCNGEFGWLGKGTAYNLEEGNFIFTGEFSGTFFNTDTSDPTHKMTFQCPGLWHVEGSEGSSNGACIGKDADGDTLTYSITGGADKDLFTIDASTGVLSFIAGPDYEDPGDSGEDNLYDIAITVSDGTNDTSQALIISVADVGEAIALTNKTINENATGATVGDLSIIDTAFGNTNITYALSGDDATYFVLDGNTLKLKSDVSADYETKSSYTLTVTATNSAGDTAEEKVVTITRGEAPFTAYFPSSPTGLSTRHLSPFDRNFTIVASTDVKAGSALLLAVDKSGIPIQIPVTIAAKPAAPAAPAPQGGGGSSS